MAWISLALAAVQCGFILATGAPYIPSIANRNGKRIVLVGSGPLPKYLIQSGYEILPFYGDLQKYNIPRRRKGLDEKKIGNPKRIFSDKIAPFTNISRKKNNRRKSEIPVTSKPLKIQSQVNAVFPTNKNAGFVMKPFSIKNGVVGIPITPSKEIIVKSPQINVKSDKPSLLPTQNPKASLQNPLLIAAVPQNKGKIQNSPSRNDKLSSSQPKFNFATGKNFLLSQAYQSNSLREGSSSDQKESKPIYAVKDNQPMQFPLPPSTNIHKGSSADGTSNFNVDLVNVATPISVVYKKPPVEILKSTPEEYSYPDPYAYGFETGDGFGTTQFRRESTNGDGIVKGNYGYKDYKGLFRQVNYVADNEGFHALVKSNEPGIGYADSADVKVLADYSPS